jgi:Glycosyltransferase (GlcNAc)
MAKTTKPQASKTTSKKKPVSDTVVNTPEPIKVPEPVKAPTPKKKSQKAKPRIFVQFASYRDPQLIPTIEDMLAKAANPEQFSFGICWQYGPDEDPNVFDGKENYRVIKKPYTESEGLGWARALTNTLYDGEELTLQLDSHHRFAQNWDKMLLEDYEQALTMSSKPIISTYCTPFNPEQPITDTAPCLMSQYEFSSDKLLMSMPYYIQDYKTRTRVIKARTISGHFFLVSGKFIEEVPYDPDIYFGGYTEETTMSVRAWTRGYDFFSPYRQYIWHEYTRNYRVKHWDDHGKERFTGKTSGERDIYARDKTRQIFQQEDHGIELGIYGLGNVRTLREYELFGGFDFKNCRIQDFTLKVNEPPNPPDYDSQFISKEYRIQCEWDTKQFLIENQNDSINFLTFGIETQSGVNLYRNDFNPQMHPDYTSFANFRHLAHFRSLDKPFKIVMYANWKNKGWGQRYEQLLPVSLTNNA